MQGETWLERQLLRRIPLWVAAFVGLGSALGAVVLAALALNAERGGDVPFNNAALAIAEVPSTARTMLRGVRSPYLSPDGAPVLPAGFQRPEGAPVDDGHLLITLYDPQAGRSYVSLLRLADGKLLRRWAPDIDALAALSNAQGQPFANYPDSPFRPGHPDLERDGGLTFVGSNFLLVRTDACAVTRWTAWGAHHSLERDRQGRLWTARAFAPPAGLPPTYRDDGPAAWDEAGRLTFAAGLTKIFRDNGLSVLVDGRPYTDDPFHLNDVQPVEFDGPHWRRGDLFLSLRHQSMVMLYRPSTGRVIWWKSGPWLGQHDVVVLDEHRIAIFDNNAAFSSGEKVPRGVSRELVFDFRTGDVTSPWQAGFERHQLKVVSNGRGLPLPGGDLLVEDTVHGQVLRMGQEGQVRWRFVHADGEGRRLWLFWARYLPAGHYDAHIEAALEARCD